MKAALRIVILCSFLSLGMGSCSPSVEQACRSQLPRLQKDLAQARGEIVRELASRDKSFAERQGRSIASVGAEGEGSGADSKEIPRRYFTLGADEKQRWDDWSTARLKLVERYLDLARTQMTMEPARKPLSDLAENFVDFTGYLDRGALYQMREALLKAQENTDTAARLGCSSVPR